jgi:hypothetical protein
MTLDGEPSKEGFRSRSQLALFNDFACLVQHTEAREPVAEINANGARRNGRERIDHLSYLLGRRWRRFALLYARQVTGLLIPF